MTADTLRASTQLAPLGKPGGPGLFHKKGQGLPVYIENIRNALIRKGHDESSATAIAISTVKRLAVQSKDPAVKAAAAKALAEWEKDKANAHVHASVDLSEVNLSDPTNLSIPVLPKGATHWKHGWIPLDANGKAVGPSQAPGGASGLGKKAAFGSAEANKIGDADTHRAAASLHTAAANAAEASGDHVKATAHRKGAATHTAKAALIDEAQRRGAQKPYVAKSRADFEAKRASGHTGPIIHDYDAKHDSASQKTGSPEIDSGFYDPKHMSDDGLKAAAATHSRAAAKASKGKDSASRQAFAEHYETATQLHDEIRARASRKAHLSRRLVDMDINLAAPHSRGDIYTHGWHLKGPTAGESKEAREIIRTNNGGAGLTGQGATYFHYVANPTPGTTAVRGETGGIVGIHSDKLQSEENAHRLKAASHSARAEKASEPELKVAHESAAIEHQHAADVAQAYNNYSAQQFKLDATTADRVAPESLKSHMSESGKPFSQVRDESEKADATAAGHVQRGEELVARRKKVEATTESSRSMSDEELQSAIEKATSAKDDYGSQNFSALINERNARQDVKSAKAKKLLNAAPRADGGFSPEEAKLIHSAMAQTKDMSTEKLTAMHAKISGAQAKTRKHQLQAEALRLELARRGKEGSAKSVVGSPDFGAMSEEKLATLYGKLSQRGAVAANDTRGAQKELISAELSRRGLRAVPDPTKRGKWTTVGSKK